jgi:hypothetical protein
MEMRRRRRRRREEKRREGGLALGEIFKLCKKDVCAGFWVIRALSKIPWLT